MRERLGRGKRLEQAAAARDAVLEELLEQVEVPLPETHGHRRAQRPPPEHRAAARLRRHHDGEVPRGRGPDRRGVRGRPRPPRPRRRRRAVHPRRDREEGGARRRPERALPAPGAAAPSSPARTRRSSRTTCSSTTTSPSWCRRSCAARRWPRSWSPRSSRTPRATSVELKNLRPDGTIGEPGGRGCRGRRGRGGRRRSSDAEDAQPRPEPRHVRPSTRTGHLGRVDVSRCRRRVGCTTRALESVALAGMTTAAARRRPPPVPACSTPSSLLSEVADELVVRTVRDTHSPWPTGSTALVRRRDGRRPAAVPEVVHRGIAAAVYGGLSAGPAGRLDGARRGGRDRASARASRTRRRGRFLTSAVNGLIGDRLVRERPRLAIPMAVRAGGRDVPLDADGLAAAFPAATGGSWSSCTACARTSRHWDRGRDRAGTTYAEALAEQGWTPVLLRANTGLACARTAWRSPRCCSTWSRRGRPRSTRIALVGHSMGGLVMRAAGAVRRRRRSGPWAGLVSDVVTLGTPAPRRPARPRRRPRQPRAWRGCPRPRRSAGSSTGARSACTTSWRGWPRTSPPLPHARYQLVAATLTALAAAPGRATSSATCWCGSPSAYGRDRLRRRAVPRAPTCCTSAAPATSACSTTPGAPRPAGLARLRPVAGRRA